MFSRVSVLAWFGSVYVMPAAVPLAVPPRLRFEQLGIAGMGPEELLMASCGADAPVFEEQNRISLAYGGKTVRNEHHRRSFSLAVYAAQ
jgi:hypothetical protein